VDAPGSDPLVFDLGTGLRFWGDALPADQPFRGTALVTHLHWDHVQGLPFFGPVLRPGSHLDVYAPPQDGVSVAEAFSDFMRPPYFPVRIADLLGDITFRETGTAPFEVGRATVRAALVPHVGDTNGYRVEVDGRVITYISDHQEPADGSGVVSPEVLDLCRGADLLIHDAQYTPEEFVLKSTWGHCTVDFAVRVAAEAGVRRLALFHHDPGHDDATIDALAAHARSVAAGTSIEEVLIAAEGLTIVLAAEPHHDGNGNGNGNGAADRARRRTPVAH
jgi:phosphoribosyl 1,2-cyclic phosphodiesterase